MFINIIILQDYYRRHYLWGNPLMDLAVFGGFKRIQLKMLPWGVSREGKRRINIFRQPLIQRADLLFNRENWIFQEDNDPKHAYGHYSTRDRKYSS